MPPWAQQLQSPTSSCSATMAPATPVTNVLRNATMSVLPIHGIVYDEIVETASIEVGDSNSGPIDTSGQFLSRTVSRSAVYVPQPHTMDRSAVYIPQTHTMDRSAVYVPQTHTMDRSAVYIPQTHTMDRSAVYIPQTHTMDRSAGVISCELNKNSYKVIGDMMDPLKLLQDHWRHDGPLEIATKSLETRFEIATRSLETRWTP
ncbi:hypothetical protein Btru_000185 [Bulinus truncatus]|nr:hypothetical protein Btru_000185 [Bulinus truncatus]